MRFIGKDLLVFSLVEYTVFRICSRNSLFYHFRFTGVVPAAGIVPVAVFVEGLLSVSLSVLVYLVKQFVSIALCFFGHSLASLLLQVCTCLYMRTIYENGFCVKYPSSAAAFNTQRKIYSTDAVLKRCLKL